LKLSLTDPDGVICGHPDRCDAIFRKGHSARAKFCETLCDRRGECKNHGYLSQFRLYQDPEETRLQVYTAQPQEAVTDAELQETTHAYGLNREGTVLVIDEADPVKMIPLRQISFEMWRDAAAFYHGTYAGKLFALLLEKTATVKNRTEADTAAEYITATNEQGLAFLEAIQRAFDAFEQYLKSQGNTLSAGLKSVQAQVNEVATWGLDAIPIDDPKVAQLHDGHPAKIDAQIESLADNHSTLIPSLRALLESTADSQTPPVRNVSEGTWEFAVPPTLNATRIIELTASDTASLRRQQLKNVNVEITQTNKMQAPWMPGNKLYQLNTGRYTPRYLFKMEKKTKYKPSGGSIEVDHTGILTTAGEKLIQLTIKTLADGKDTLIVAPGAFCEKDLWASNSLIQKLHALPNAHIATHQHAVGVNRYSELPRAIVFHYEPHILELAFATKAMHPAETLDFTREQITLETHGVILQDVWRYKDPRVQLIYDAMCVNTMMQSENRIRPQLYKNKEIWRLTAEPIPAPTIPILFSIPDWQAWIDSDRTETFDAFLQAHHNRELAEITAQENISTRQAYRRTEQKRQQNKSERNAEIIRLHNDGHKQSDISMHCNVSLRTVKNVLAEQKKKCRN
jgi:hypothetical protein